jgi:hypothetical protein
MCVGTRIFISCKNEGKEIYERIRKKMRDGVQRSGHGGSVQQLLVACQEDSDSASISVQPMGPQNVILILYPLITSVMRIS